MPQNQQPDNSDLHNDIRKVIEAISNSKADQNARLDEIAKKQAEIPAQFESLRKELSALFVPRSEFDPKHGMLVDRIDRQERDVTMIREHFDKYLSEVSDRLQEYSVLKQTVKNNTDDIDDLRTRQAGAAGRILPWVGTVIAIIGFLLSLFQHVHIT